MYVKLNKLIGKKLCELYRGFARQACCMAGTKDSFSYGKKMFFLMQNTFIDPAMQHGCRAKPLLYFIMVFVVRDLVAN